VVGRHQGQNAAPSVSASARYGDIAEVNLKAPAEILHFEVQYFINQGRDNISILPLI